MTTSDMGARSEAQHEEVEKTWRDDDATELPSLPPTRAKNSKEEAKVQRDNWCRYFNTVGSVSWQDEKARLT